MNRPPYRTVIKPYGRALVALAAQRPEILCLSGDLTRQCEVDLFQERFPDRFINGGMAEANLAGMAGALARRGFQPFVHTFGVFATRRCYDQVAMAIAYPGLPVRLIGFMPGISSPGGPSHQAIDDVALMRALPGMTVLDPADAVEVEQAVAVLAEVPGPAYLRLKRGEVPVIFGSGHQLEPGRAGTIAAGSDVALIASGMGVAIALSARDALGELGISASVTSVSTLKPLDGAHVVAAVSGKRAAITVENHSIVGGLGSAVAEVLAEAGLGVPLRRIGIRDTFAEGARSAEYLFGKYGLSTDSVLAAAWQSLGRPGAPPPARPVTIARPGTYSPV